MNLCSDEVNIEDYIIDEVIQLFKDNLKMSFNNDKYLNEIKKYIRNTDRVKALTNLELKLFALDALECLLLMDYLYDFRDLE